MALPGTGHSGVTTEDVAFNAQRKELVLAGNDGRLRFWNSDTLQPLGVGASLADQITDVAVNPVTGVIAAGLASGHDLEGPGFDGGIDLLTPTMPQTVVAHLPLIHDATSYLSFSPSGRQLAVHSIIGNVIVYDLTKPRYPSFTVTGPDPDGGGFGLRWTADGTRILAGGHSVLATIDVRTRKAISRQPSPGGEFTGIAVDPVGGSIVAGTLGGHFELLAADGSPKQPKPFTTDAGLSGVAVSADGKVLAGTGLDGTLALWSLPSGQGIVSALPLIENNGVVTFLDDHRLVLAGANSSTAVVDLDPKALISNACTVAGRNLTRSEFSQYLGSGLYHRTCPQWPAGS